MIKILIITWLIAIHAFAALAIWDTDLPYRIDRKLNLGLLNPPEITHFYDKMLGSHLQLDGSVENDSVIFLGDSITQGLNVAAVTNQAINYGIGMDTSYGLLKRVSQYKSLTKASTVVIAIGINDLIRVNRRPVDVLKNYEAILESLPSEANVIMQAVFPVDETKDFAGANAKIIQLNGMLKTLAKEQGHTFVNLHERYLSNGGNLKGFLHIGDGLHLSSEGYKLWITALNKTLSDPSD